MQIDLPDDLALALQKEVDGGRAASIETLVEKSVRAHLKWLTELRQSLEAAEREYDRDGGTSLDDMHTEMEVYLDLRISDD